MTQKQIKKLLRSKGYCFSKISFPLGFLGNNSLFSISGPRYSHSLYFYLVLEDYDGEFECEYFLCQISFEFYNILCDKFLN